MVSYLIFVGVIMTIVAGGLVYAVTSDFVDIFIPIYDYPPLGSYNDSDSRYYFDMFITLFKYYLLFAIVVIGFFAWSMAQKPERSW